MFFYDSAKIYHETFENMTFSVGMEHKNDPLNIPIFGSQSNFLQNVRSRIPNKHLGTLYSDKRIFSKVLF